MIYIDLRALLFDPVDLKGIPSLENGKTTWNIPDFLPDFDSEDLYLIVIEELPAASHSVQMAFYQLILDRKLEKYTLPHGAYIMACGNNQQDRGVWNKLPPALASRMIHVDVKVDVQDWLLCAEENDISLEIRWFMMYKSELLHQYDPQKNTGEFGFPCPRTWKFIDDLYKESGSVSSNIELAGYRGTIGQGAAVEFTGFLQVCRQLPHLQTIIDDPQNADVPPDPQVLIATCGGLYRMANEYNFDSIITYAERLRPELGQYLVSSSVRNNKELQYTKNYVSWNASHGGNR